MVVVELKAVEGLQPIHEAQLLTYLKLGGWPIGLLINFNVPEASTRLETTRKSCFAIQSGVTSVDEVAIGDINANSFVRRVLQNDRIHPK